MPPARSSPKVGPTVEVLNIVLLNASAVEARFKVCKVTRCLLKEQWWLGLLAIVVG